MAHAYLYILLISFFFGGSWCYKILNASSNGEAEFKVLLDPLPNITSSVYIQNQTGHALAKASGTQWEAFGKYSTCRISFSGNTVSGNIKFILKNVTADDAGEYYLRYRAANERYNRTVDFKLLIDTNITYSEEGSDAELRFYINDFDYDFLKSPTGKYILDIWFGSLYIYNKEKYNISANRIAEDKELHITVRNVSSDDEGIYAFSRRPIGAILAIYAPPDKPVIVQETELRARSPLTLSCVTKSNTVPKGFETIPMYRKWFVDDKRIENNTQYTITPSFLRIASVQKDDVGKRIHCQAEEIASTPSSLSDEYKIQVKFSPLITLSPNNTSYTQSEGDKMNNVTCYAECLPECQLTWVTPTSDSIAGPVLSLRTLNRKDHGSYSCIATNDVGRDMKTMFINVQYSVTVIEYKTDYTAGIVMSGIATLLIIGTICAVLFLKFRTAFFQTRKSGNQKMKMSDINGAKPGSRAISSTSENKVPKHNTSQVYENALVTENEEGMVLYESLRKEDASCADVYEVVTPKK